MPAVTRNLLVRVVIVVASGLLTLAPLAAGPVVIHEVLYAPADKTVREEFVELHNASDAAVDISGWFFSNGIFFVFAEGTVIGPREYLVVAEDPQALEGIYGPLPVVGPFAGKLSNSGEDLALRNDTGGLEDVVDYRRGFPWPNAGGEPSRSIELIHTDLDNALGGSWRISDGGTGDASELVPAGQFWRYRKGTAEASSPPSAWRARTFDDSQWASGRTTIGYGEGFVTTTLGDMRSGYSSVYLRRAFEVDDLESIGGLTLAVQYDDGFNAWINGTHVAGDNVPSEEMPYDGLASSSSREDPGFASFQLPNPAAYLVEGANVLAIQLHNASLAGSSDAFIDARILSGAAADGPTPGALNSVYSDTSPPQIRQVSHEPRQPVSDDFVSVSARVTDADGVSSVVAEYQLVDPGQYIRLQDAAFATDWTAVDMLDDGAGGDLVAADDVYTAILPQDLQVHRRLVRYRISATDGATRTVRVPYGDDPQPNFAYFVYDGIPGWRGASRPGSTPVQTFSAEGMSSLPAYHLIAREADVLACQYNSSFENTRFPGTLVYDGDVYDHIEFRIRGEFSTYVSGKNKWKFFFHRGHDFRARDNYGELFGATRRIFNLSNCSTPWVPTNRGMAGLGEAVAFRSYALAGLPSSNTTYIQLRIIDDELEAHPSDQYSGDLWGLYSVVEQPDGRFLDERGLPDGNVYKIESGNGDKKNQGPTQPTNTADYNALRSGWGTSSISWWRTNVDLESYFSFRAVNAAVNNMDVREGWNHYQYHSPDPDWWTVMPWDLDMLYMPVTHWSGTIDFRRCLNISTIALEHRNRARELQDLLFTPTEFDQVVDEILWFVSPSGQSLTFADVDEAMWNYHPRTASNHRGAFYRNPSTHGARGGTITRTLVSADHRGMAQWIKDFALRGYGASGLSGQARDTAIPDRPTVTAIGTASFPLDDLAFRSSAFSDPQGDGSFAAMEWRVAEVTPPSLRNDPTFRKLYEIDATWESGELTAFEEMITIPAQAVKVGATYRARVRMKDSTGRWSHWSLPVGFTTTAPSEPFPQQRDLRVTEVMYRPLEGSALEFVELKNVGLAPLDLRPVAFTDGIEFRFADGDVHELAPGELVVVVKDRTAFEARYGPDVAAIAGEYSGRFSNSGERLTLAHGLNATILDFAYSDEWYPATDGGGYSLVILDPEASAHTWNDPQSWRESAEIEGSPGWDDLGTLPGGRQLPGDLNQDSHLDIGDVVTFLLHLYRATAVVLPCEGNTIEEGANLTLADFDSDGAASMADAVQILAHLFDGGPPHALGTFCVRLEGCESVCRR